MPALPAFVLLSAAVPLLVPTRCGGSGRGSRRSPPAGRAGGRRSPSSLSPGSCRSCGSRRRASRTQQRRPRFVADEVIVSEIGVPADADVIDLSVVAHLRQPAALDGLDVARPHVLPRLPRLGLRASGT